MTAVPVVIPIALAFGIAGLPIAEDNDAATVTLTVDATELLPFGVRRILSVNGGSTIPSGVSIDLITV